MSVFYVQVFVRLATKEQIVTNVTQDTMVMDLHVLPVVLTRLHLQVVLLQQQVIVSFHVCVKSVLAFIEILAVQLRMSIN